MEGQCGSCWAFSVTGMLEGMRAIKERELAPLSAQQLIDCLTTQGGCNRGDLLMPTAMVVEADNLTCQLYTSGVIQSDCEGTSLGHSALAVGYNVFDNVEA